MSNHTKAGRRRSFRERVLFAARYDVVLQAHVRMAEAIARYLSRASRPQLSPEEKRADVRARFLAARETLRQAANTVLARGGTL